MRPIRALFVLSVTFGWLLSLSCIGPSGTSCSVEDNGDGTATITCTDGTSVTVGDGNDGVDGDSCTAVDNADGSVTITCEDGTSVTITDGESGGSCTIRDNGDSTSTITCADGTTVVIGPGESGADQGAAITSFHGADYLHSVGEYADGKFLAAATITGATADAGGTVTVSFRVTDGDGDPVIALSGVSATIAKLVPVFDSAGVDRIDSRWVPYIYRRQEVDGDGYPSPDGTFSYQGNRESNGQLIDDGQGDYRYVLATNLATASVGGSPVGYERGRLHRVSIMMGGHEGATADASFDFVPDGGAVTLTRDVVTTETCRSCHGGDFAAHGGDRLSVENCTTCHNGGGGVDPHGGASLDLEVMIHKIHAGGELPSVAGPDGNPWSAADNGEYAIWGRGEDRHSWEKAGFPAVLENCTKCHTGGGSDVDAWMDRPTAAACGSCHDDVDFASPTTTHVGGPQANDDSCDFCHAEGGLSPVSLAHAWTEHDPRDVPELTADITLTPPPANGLYYTGSEAPVVRLVLSRDGTPIDHRILRGSAQGCIPSGFPLACQPDADGKFATSNLFVSGPRAARSPVLTTRARAAITASATGPFTFAAATTLTVKLDQGVDVYLDDAWHTRTLGTVAVAIPAATYTSDALATLLNGNAAFTARAIATVEAGRLVLRSRNKGAVHALQLVAGDVTTAVFAGDVGLKVPGGFFPSNTLASAASTVGAIPSASDDPKVTLFADRIEYRLDPVADLAPGTYIVGLELAQVGRIDNNNYRTPTIAKVPFQVGRADPEPQVASNCNSCHQSSSGAGLIVDPSRHNKVLDDGATDLCGACHDDQPQDPTCPPNTPGCGATTLSGWTGGRPISKRVHAVHFGSELLYPLATVDYSNGDPVTGRDWFIEFPMDIRDCQSCHPDGDTSGTWATEPARLPCQGCHDGDAAMVHMRLMTYDPTPATPWSGDEQETCETCH